MIWCTWNKYCFFLIVDCVECLNWCPKKPIRSEPTNDCKMPKKVLNLCEHTYWCTNMCLVFGIYKYISVQFFFVVDAQTLFSNVSAKSNMCCVNIVILNWKLKLNGKSSQEPALGASGVMIVLNVSEFRMHSIWNSQMMNWNVEKCSFVERKNFSTAKFGASKNRCATSAACTEVERSHFAVESSVHVCIEHGKVVDKLNEHQVNKLNTLNKKLNMNNACRSFNN